MAAFPGASSPRGHTVSASLRLTENSSPVCAAPKLGAAAASHTDLKTGLGVQIPLSPKMILSFWDIRPPPVLVGRVLLASSGQSPGLLLSSLQCTGQPERELSSPGCFRRHCVGGPTTAPHSWGDHRLCQDPLYFLFIYFFDLWRQVSLRSSDWPRIH